MAELNANGQRFHVQQLGESGPRVVFLHGLVMDNLSSWYFTVANPAARICRALLYDLRGHGKSERPREGYGLDQQVQDFAAILAGLDIHGPVHLVGNSFGGLLAQLIALRLPARVASLVLVDPLVPLPGWSDTMNATLGLVGEERNARIADSFRHWLGRHSERKRNRLARAAQELVENTSLLADLRDSASFEAAELARITCPVLCISGTDSDLRSQSELLAATLPDCQVQWRPGCTHSVLWEDTDALRDAIVARLAEWAKP